MGKVYFNVEDIFGNNHKEVELIKVYDNTAVIYDANQNLNWLVRKRNLGLEETNLEHRKYPGHFDYRNTKRQWKGKEQKLINKIKIYYQ